MYQIHTFNTNLKDEGTITTHLLCTVKQVFSDKNIMFEIKKHSVIVKFRILNSFKRMIKFSNYLR